MFLKKLIATLFVDNPNNYKHVMHIDGNLLNFKASNLKWVQYQEWANHKRGKNTIKEKKKLIERLIHKGYSDTTICVYADTYPVAFKTVYKNVNNVL